MEWEIYFVNILFETRICSFGDFKIAKLNREDNATDLFASTVDIKEFGDHN